MSKTLIALVLKHETKIPVADAIDATASGAVKGKVKATAAALSARPVRKMSRKGLYNGDYTLPEEVTAAVGVSTITVRRSKVGNPYLLLDGKFYPAGDSRPDSYVQCWTAVTEGIATMTPESVAKREEAAARYAAKQEGDDLAI
jgi:hypothetical protein